ncbi:MAG TPA: phytanoyl-CoA dioxygenase family protein [Planctomycetaceae bacterium]|nr:phytanoyl-CoA dioxygenase family protein [Planctomycetaceae bacterium]
MILTQEQRESFDRDGYLVINPGLSEDCLTGILRDLDDKFTTTEKLNVSYRNERRIQDAWRISEHVKAAALAPRMLGALQELYGRKPLPFQTLNFPKGTEQAVHSDTIHFNSKPAGFMCGVWLALEDIDLENGPLVYYPGSHKLTEITIDDIDRAGRLTQPFMERMRESWSRVLRRQPPPPPNVERDYPRYEKFIADLIAASGMEPHYATIRRGEALIWASNLLHGGAPQKDKSRSRHSQVTHVFFEGCQYYTPLLTQGKNVHWRNPEWIA